MIDDWTTKPDLTPPPPLPGHPLLARLLSTAGLWLWIGFAGGALVLLALAVPLEARLRVMGAAQGLINAVLATLALIWAAVALGLAATIQHRVSGRALAAVHAAGALLSAAVFVLFLSAGSDAVARLRAGGDRFVFGAYPSADALRAMRREGFTGVVSLMSDLVPFEAVLTARERAAAREAGLEFVHVPMLPWVSGNVVALNTLRRFARRSTGWWYVHCYLGRHRVLLARYAMLEAAGSAAAATARVELPDSFERGPLLRVDSLLALGPLPTRDEWSTWIVPSGVRRVIAMLDPASPNDAPWITQETDEAGAAGITLIVLPVRRREDADAVADRVRASRLRTYVHGFRTDERVDWVRLSLAGRTSDE